MVSVFEPLVAERRRFWGARSRSGGRPCRLAVGLAAFLGACGARDVGVGEDGWVAIAVDPRSPADMPAPETELQRCQRNADCRAGSNRCVVVSCVAGRCQPRERSCDDADPCTEDSCDPERGCQHRFLTEDRDGDGYRAPRAGFDPGEPGACGDDCDDGSGVTYPGAPELCDGVDNDCNGIIDDGRAVALPEAEPLWLSADSSRASVSSIAHDGQHFVVALSASRTRSETELVAVSEGRVRWRAGAAQTNSDNYPGTVIWTGRELALAWEDRRDDDFEIYFNRFDTLGNKLGPDQRLSEATGFSLAPDLVATEQEYFVVWADRRLGADDFRIFGQWVAADGRRAQTHNVLLSPQTPGAVEPRLALGSGTSGLLFHRTEVQGGQVFFQILDEQFEPMGMPQALSGPQGVGSAIAYADGRYYAFWYDYEVTPGDAIWGAVFSESGDLLMPGRRLTPPALFARAVSVSPLGKRWILAWSEYQEGHFGIHIQTFDQSLNPVGDVLELRREMGDLDAPRIAVSPQGEIGVAYTDRSAGQAQAYLVMLDCRGPED